MDRLEPLTGDYVETDGQKRAWVTMHGQRLRIELTGQGALLPLWPDRSGRWSFGEAQQAFRSALTGSTQGTQRE